MLANNKHSGLLLKNVNYTKTNWMLKQYMRKTNKKLSSCLIENESF